ncbi:22560_t:CDS:2 [Dentiscutata erythropus]|uniref:Signal recognition particle receptor subunit beta n=1 Tax=Dentiscutata erythropus TaxID=1348616 RepID=A0A9N9AJ87_9GLOM|nr:22560_t:CDS:2 [Dentiscutata erythropus]
MDMSTLTWTVFALLVIAIAIAALNFLGNRTKKDTFLLLGLSDSGKTLLFLKLRHGSSVNVQTHTSMKENEGQFIINDNGTPLTKNPTHVVDVPGHEKLRFKFSDFIPITRGIIFVIDSSTCAKNSRQIAEYLYDIFSHKKVKNIPMLIACNMSDMITALPPERIRTILENEINRLRVTRTAGLDHQDSVEDVEFLGYESEDFKFEHLENEVVFEKCSVKEGEINVIKEWIVDAFQGGK